MTAADFLAARARQSPIDSLPSANGFDLDAAYAMEKEIMRLREESGHGAVGRKVGFASKAMWRIHKLETVVWAHMFEDTVMHADQGVAELAISHLRAPKIEPEIVIKVGDPEKGLAGAEWIALGFEIVDCPYPDWKFTPVDFVAAWGLHAGLIVGQRKTVNSIATLSDHLADFKLELTRDNELVEEGAGKNCLRSPALCLEELARASAARGDALRPGEIISTGSLTDAQPIAPGQEWRAELNGLPLASLRVKFT
ncbi:MAG: fumarylacetoacetate hydrolase family protein [Bryobacteraceae bacterium]